MRSVREQIGLDALTNPVLPDLVARCANTARKVGKDDSSTNDKEIQRRRFLPIDCDPQRPSGIAASESEHDAALQMRDAIAADLRIAGWPEPIAGDSGNGGHLLFLIDLPADDGGVVQTCLKALAVRHNTAAVMVDTSVSNAARIWRLYGTPNRKGDHIPSRPHRLSRITSAPAALQAVPLHLLHQLAASGPAESVPEPTAPIATVDRVEDFLTKHHIAIRRGPEPYQGGRRWILEVCPWNSDHNKGEAFIVQFASGKVSAGCHHNSCANKGWVDLYRMYNPTREGVCLPMAEGTRKHVAVQEIRAHPPGKDGADHRYSDMGADFGRVRPPMPARRPFPLATLGSPTLAMLATEGAAAVKCPIDFTATALLGACSVALAGAVKLRT
jgi:hypothetical protein